MDFRRFFGGRKPRPDAAIRRHLDKAAEWLNASNAANARGWALGQERRFEVDQDSGRITLFFADGSKVLLRVQIIASFLPADCSVRWAWANDSVDPALAAASSGLRSFGEAQGVALFSQPEVEMPFDDLVNYAALAASRFNCIGLYRCLREDDSTAIVGFGTPQFQSKDGETVDADSLWPKGRASQAFEAQARSLVERWDSEMFPIDRDCHRRKYRSDDARIAAMYAALDAKDRIYQAYWSPRKDSWRPDYFAWPSEHDPAGWLPTLTLPRRAGGCLVVRFPAPHRSLAYVVQEQEGQARIVDVDEDWGGSLVWIGPPD